MVKLEKTKTSIIHFFLFLIFLTNISLAQQYGDLILLVKDCNDNSYLSDAKVEVSSYFSYLINYTSSDGYSYFYRLPVGNYSIVVSKVNYYSNETSIYIGCGQTVRISLCLKPKIVCIPGEIRNRKCLSLNQVYYEKCSNEGIRWENVTESCGSGYVCENGYCIISKDGWYSTTLTKCENGVLRVLQEYRKFYCFGATCVYQVTQTRWVDGGFCLEEQKPQNFTYTQNYKDGWYETALIRCNTGNNKCGYGLSEKLYEYRKYYCLGLTCTYQITAKEWRVVGECFVGCPSGYECLNGICAKIQTFDCNLLDGWYSTNEERCNLGSNLCGYGIREVKEEYRDYYPVVDYPKSSSDCGYRIIQTRWKYSEQCYIACGLLYQVPSLTTQDKCKIVLTVRESFTNYPISNVKVCNENCYITNEIGLIEFYVKPGYYSFFVQKDGYSSASFQISCSYSQPTIYKNIYLNKIDKKSCSLLNGWYYTTLTDCNIGNYECGPGILLRREEYREYKDIIVNDLKECKDYKVVGYRWVEEGLCYKNCSRSKVCEYGFCRNVEIVSLEPKFNEKTSIRLNGLNQDISEFDFSFPFLFLIIFIIFLLLRGRKEKEEVIQ